METIKKLHISAQINEPTEFTIWEPTTAGEVVEISALLIARDDGSPEDVVIQTTRHLVSFDGTYTVATTGPGPVYDTYRTLGSPHTLGGSWQDGYAGVLKFSIDPDSTAVNVELVVEIRTLG